MNFLVEKLLARRGITPADWEALNNPEHAPLAHIDELAEKLHGIHDAGEKIVILPDFDMDGIMSGTVGYGALSALGFDVELFVPNPAEGYGFAEKQIDRLLNRFLYADAIITCDTGIGCLAGVKYAKERGLDVLITDHHIENPECSPRGVADVVVDPCGTDETYEHPAICGAYVFWQCLNRYAELYGNDIDRERMWFLRIFAGIGTVSDVMPVLYENRALLKDAIDIARQIWTTSPRFLAAIKDAPAEYTQVFRGAYAAMNMFAGAGKLKDPADVDEEFFGFYLAPAFNAVKRMDGDMERAFDVFLGKRPSDSVNYLIDLNEQRKKCVNEAYEKLMAADNPLAPFCYVSDAIPGILGLLAMRISQSSGYPCIIVNQCRDGSLSGSGRSPSWYPFITATSHLGNHIAGHEGAFGCSFKNEEKLHEIADMLKEDIEKLIEEHPEKMGSLADTADFTISTLGDGDISLAPATFVEFIDEMEMYRPFGRGFESPCALLTFNADDAVFTAIGADKTHLKIRLPLTNTATKTEYFDVLCWGQASLIDTGAPSGKMSVLGSLSINEFRGNRTAQFTGDVVEIEQ